MGVNDMMGDGFDADASRYDRMNRTQPAEFAPGQDAVFQSNDIFSTSTMSNNPGQMNDVFSGGNNFGGGDIFGGGNSFGNGSGDMFNSFNNGAMGAFPSPNGMIPQNQQQQQPQDFETQVFNGIAKGAKASVGFTKEVMGSIKSLTPRFYSEWGRKVVFISAGVGVVGIISSMFGLGVGLDLAIGGLLSVGGGACLWLFNADNAKNYESEYKDIQQTQSDQSQISIQQPMMDNSFGDSFGADNFNSDFGSDDFGSNDFGDDFGSDGFGDDEDFSTGGGWDMDDFDDEDEDEPVVQAMSTEEALESLPNIQPGIYTREYLWEMFTKVLPSLIPKFAEMRDIDEDEDAFLAWDDRLREAAEVAGCNEDYLPELSRLQENLFTIVVTCDRPKGFKPEAVANELANIYAYSCSDSGEKNDKVFAKYDTIGKECRITVFTGQSAMISLKDMMLNVKDFILDTNNFMPVVLGTNQLGKVLTADFKKLESIIIAGMPRSGKSWFAQAVLTQMCAFVPPSELNIYICDPKEGISDFKAFCLPHVKKFVSGDDNIVKTLRDVVRIEAPRRKRIIGDAGCVNIWDFKKMNPDVKLPIIYVAIDEVVTLAERMEKEVKKEFQGLLIELISQLPALGIRAFLIPHVIKNDIIAKTATDLVNCRISVLGNQEHIEATVGAKPKDFPYRLVNQGDMAVRLTGIAEVMYIHGPALTPSNPENNELFRYLRKVWNKIEPDECDSVVVQNATMNEEMDDLLNSLNDNMDDEDLDMFTDENDNGLSGFNF